MNQWRNFLFDIGNSFIEIKPYISGIISTLLGSIFTALGLFRKGYLEVRIFNLDVISSVFLEFFVLAILFIGLWILIHVSCKRAGQAIIWLSQHKQGPKIAKTDLKIVETKNTSVEQEFVLKVSNNENFQSYNANIIYGIMPFYIKKGDGIMGNLNGYWIKEDDKPNNKIDVRDNKIDFEYRVNIQGNDKRNLFFIRVDKISKKFFMRNAPASEQEFLPGRYMLKIFFYGEMVQRNCIAEQDGQIIFKDDGTIKFDLKKVKKKRGWVSLVKDNGFIWKV